MTAELHINFELKVYLLPDFQINEDSSSKKERRIPSISTWISKKLIHVVCSSIDADAYNRILIDVLLYYLKKKTLWRQPTVF